MNQPKAQLRADRRSYVNSHPTERLLGLLRIPGEDEGGCDYVRGHFHFEWGLSSVAGTLQQGH